MRLIGILAMLSALVAAGATSAPSRQRIYSDAQAGLSVRLPTGWHVVHRRLTECSDPTERLTVVGHGALVMLQERLHLRSTKGFPARPSRFDLRGQPHPMECCAPRSTPGWSVNFADRGRGFYAYVYLGGPGTRADAVSILNSLHVKAPWA